MSNERRNRRGVESIEFAMILPVFIAMIFAVIEYSWYMFQRSAVIDAAREACQMATSLDPDRDDFETAAEDEIPELMRAAGSGAGIDCDDSDYSCTVTITDMSTLSPPRLMCEVDVNYVSLSGFLPTSGLGSAGVLPETVHGVAVAVFEEAD